MIWHAVQTHPQGERWVEKQLRLLGYTVLYPHWMERVARRRKGILQLWMWKPRPLFSRYVFVGIERHQSVGAVFSTPGVSKVLMGAEGGKEPWDRQPKAIPAEIMDALRAKADKNGLIDMDSQAEPDHPYRAGMTVELGEDCPLRFCFGDKRFLIEAIDKSGQCRLYGGGIFGLTEVHFSQLGAVVGTAAADAVVA